MAADTSTLYCTLSPISFSDFTPSRTTRVSSNPILQEHSVVESLCKIRKASSSSLASANAIKPRRGRYVQVEFVALLRKKNGSVRKHSLSDPTGSSHALHLRSRIDPSRKAVRFKSACDGNIPSPSPRHAATCTRSAKLRLTGSQRWPTLTTKARCISPPGSPPPPPPPGILTRCTASLDRVLQDTPACSGLACGVRPTETSQFLSSRGLERVEDGSCGGAAKRRPLPSADGSSTSSPPFSPQPDDSPSPMASPFHHRRPSEGDRLPTMSRNRERRPSFLELEAGEQYACYRAHYMGYKVVNEYTDRVDECALQLINSRATDVAVYVTAQKVYLAERPTDVLVASFAIRDILHMTRCSKNRWIIGITTWRFRTTPECRIFKCGDSITATALFDGVQSRVQNLDNSTTSEVGATLASRAPLWAQCPSSSYPTNNNSTDEPYNNPHNPPPPPPSAPLKLFQKFQAAYIGSAVAGKTHSVHELVEKVLRENHPSQARESLLWLGEGQLRLTDLAEDPETAFALHDVVRIRAIGVYAVDKRFVGYITKDEGRPLTGHVLWCCTTGLMLTFLSELRRACEVQFQSRGGSLYEELCIDDCEGAQVPSEIEERTQQQDQTNHSSLLHRLKSLTLSQRMHHTHSVKEPAKFYTTPDTNTTDTPLEHSIRKKDEVTAFSPGAGLSDEDYARFTVTYVGSTNTETPFTQQAIVDAMLSFSRHGIAAGQATVTKNSISMQVAAFGITLSDQSRQLFVTRNYPRNQIAGYCVHPSMSGYFAFAARRPGLDTLKCHVFKQLAQPCELIIGAMKFWLEMNLTDS